MEYLLLFVAKAYVYLCCKNLVAKAFGHVLESMNCAFKPQANGSTCHPFIGG
jgi:hypothetical protein